MVIIVVLAMLLIGPERLPEYASKLRHLVRQTKQFADGARTQLREQMGPEFDDIDWKAYDPRQYDPRRIVREALHDLDTEVTSGAKKSPEQPPGNQGAPASTPGPTPGSSQPMAGAFDPNRPTPYDPEAT